MDDVRKTLTQRGQQYGAAWKIAGQLMSQLDLSVMQASPYLHNWTLILSKLVRALATPSDPEHWRDIAGYATLVLDDLTQPKQASGKFYDDGGLDDLVRTMRGSVLTNPKTESGDHYDILPS